MISRNWFGLMVASLLSLGEESLGPTARCWRLGQRQNSLLNPDKSKFVVVSKWVRCFNFFFGSISAKSVVELVVKCSN